MTRSDGQQLPFLDFAKGYAILTIVCYHAWQKVALPPAAALAISFGGTGVHLFFLLSGFGLSLSRPAASALDFYRRRALKIWLPYVLALTLSLAAALSLGLFASGWRDWLAGVGLYQMFLEQHIESFGGHFWFISTIIQFYLAWPLLVFLRARLGNRVFLGLSVLLSVAWWVVVYALDRGEWRTWNSFFLQFLWEFALGMVLAERFKKDRQGAPRPRVIRGDFWNYSSWIYGPVALLFSGLMAAVTLLDGPAGRIFNDVPALLGYTAWCILLFRLGSRYWPALARFFGWVGGFSFSLYLIHVLVLELYGRLLALGGWTFNGWTILIYGLLALLTGWALEPLSRALVGLFLPGSSVGPPDKTLEPLQT